MNFLMLFLGFCSTIACNKLSSIMYVGFFLKSECARVSMILLIWPLMGLARALVLGIIVIL